jgi:hypothetical protein
MADTKDGTPKVRRGSVISANEMVQAGLSSEDDAAVLGMLGPTELTYRISDDFV